MTTLDLLGTGSSWLLTYALHSTLLIGGAWLITRWIRTPVVRDTLWKSAMFGAVLTATAQVAAGYRPFAGQWQVSLEDELASGILPVAAPVADLEFPEPPVAAATPVETQPITMVSEYRRADASAVDDVRPTTVVPMDERVSSAQSSPTWTTRVVAAARGGMSHVNWSAVLIGIWLIGAGMGVARLIWARIRLGLCLRSRKPVRDPSLRRFVTGFSSMAGIRRPIDLTWSSVLAVPAALRSEVCLPKRALFEMNIAKHRSVIAHEVAHIARHDPAWFFMSLLIERVFFFQPLNRIARRRMQELAEYICDDWAMYRAGTKRSLAESLADVAGWLKGTQPIAMLPSAGQDTSQLVRRVERILETTTTPEAWMPKRSRVAAVFIGLFFVALLLPGVSCANAASASNEPLQISPRATRSEAPPSPPSVSTHELQSVLAEPDVWSEPDGLSEPVVVTPVADIMDAHFEHAEMDVVTPMSVHVDFPEVPSADVIDVPVAWEHALVEPTDAVWPALSATTSVEWAPPAVSVDVTPSPEGSATQQDTPDPRVIRGLIEALRDQSPEVRKEAASALGRVGDSTAVMPLASALSDANPEVRAAAAGALARYRDARAVPALAAALSDSESGVRRSALRALVRTRHESVVPALIGALDDEAPEVREMAADVLGDLKDSRAVPGLINTVRDQHPDVREEAIQSLYELRDSRAVPALIAATRDSVTKVRRIAASALGHFGDTSAVPALIECLSDSAAIVRRYAVSSLGRLKDARAVDPLVSALKDPDAEVRTTVVRALAQLRDSGSW